MALVAVVSLLLVGLQAACARQPTDVTEEKTTNLQTLQPEAIQTLTAWPTAPPIVTLPPTTTPAPQPLWTASPTAAVTGPAPTARASATAVQPSNGAVPPVGANPAPTRLLIPVLGLDVPVIEVSWDVVFEDGTWKSVWQTADGAAGHHRSSANPGEAGNIVISGHHNAKGEVFREVSEIGQPGVAFGPGDLVILEAAGGQRHTYQVEQWERFPVEDSITAGERRRQGQFLATGTEPLLTLVTCWPYDSSSHRVIVVARLLREQ